MLKAFPEPFSSEMKPTKCLAKGKKWGKKSEYEGSKLLCHLEILLFAHARTLKDNILHLDQRAAKGTTYRKRPENGWTGSKTRVSAKFPGPNG